MYLGFGLITMGLILTLIGVGDKGFKTFELKLLGPSLVFGGFLTLLKLLVNGIRTARMHQKHTHELCKMKESEDDAAKEKLKEDECSSNRAE